MENFESFPQSNGNLTINQPTRDFLLETTKWAKFLAIMGYIGIGFLVLAGIIVGIAFSFIDEMKTIGFPMGLIGLVYVIIAVVYYFPVTYLYRFSVQARSGLMFNNQETFTSGIENLKSHYRFIGIFTIVILSIYALILILIVPLTLLLA